MCSPLRALKKIFKKVAKHAKIIIPVVLGAAAIYFTAGAALGGGAGISGLVGQLGLGSTLSSVLTGAVTQAGIGAAIGAGTSLVTGGDVGKGALTGAAVGAVTGGITGAVNAPTTRAQNFGRDPQFPIAGNQGSGSPSSDPLTGLNPLTDTAVRLPNTAGGGGGGLLSGAGKFITDNQTLLGGALEGLGAGIAGAAQADAEVEAVQIVAERQAEAVALENERIASNFDVSGGGGLLTGATPDLNARPTPTQQFSQPSVLGRNRGARWQFNPESGRVELVPAA